MTLGHRLERSFQL